MPKFSKKSLERLATCDEKLQELFNVVITGMDCSIISGHRSVEEQQELYSLGRTKPGSRVTNVDGVRVMSRHNYNPSKAVDVMRYPIKWDDKQYNSEFGFFVKGVACGLGIDVEWGGDWESFLDVPHWQVV